MWRANILLILSTKVINWGTNYYIISGVRETMTCQFLNHGFNAFSAVRFWHCSAVAVGHCPWQTGGICTRSAHTGLHMGVRRRARNGNAPALRDLSVKYMHQLSSNMEHANVSHYQQGKGSVQQTSTNPNPFSKRFEFRTFRIGHSIGPQIGQVLPISNPFNCASTTVFDTWTTLGLQWCWESEHHWIHGLMDIII